MQQFKRDHSGQEYTKSTNNTVAYSVRYITWKRRRSVIFFYPFVFHRRKKKQSFMLLMELNVDTKYIN